MKKNEPKPYDPAKIEAKWQKKWAKSKLYKSVESASKDKFYVLDMFPYPSGEGLHVGHPKGYIATDIVSRFQRMNGKSVLHPMGFDAFGLPAENYALKTKTNPEIAVKKNVARYKEQLELLGFDYDWSREVNTTDPKYYRWTQWIFLQLFKKGLAYESYEPVNWCPTDKTVLANEDVENGRCERCGTPVEKKPMRQWVLKITDYADRLLKDLDAKGEYKRPVLFDKTNPHQAGKPLVKRNVAHAIVFDPKTNKYLIIRNKKHGWDTVIIGGIENGENVVDTARREIREETGYTDLEFKRILGGQTEAHYYAKHKGENRIAYAQAVYFELKSDTRVPIAPDEDKNDEIIWIDQADFVPGKMVNSEMPTWLERLKDQTAGSYKPLLDWPESIKEAQRNWIGRSEGAEIDFRLTFTNNKTPVVNPAVKVFTTRPDTLFGVTYLVLAPEHPWLGVLMPHVANKAEVEAYISKTSRETEIERTDITKEKTGVELKGIKAVNPANNDEVPVWIADYVLADYGTGAVMAVPAHDERDWAFAKKFNLPIRNVVVPSDANSNLANNTADKSVAYVNNGKLINSNQFDGKNSASAMKEITSFVGGKWVTKYKLRDWVFSRQRYWGEPIPVIHCEQCGVVAVPEKDLPVKLPRVKSYEPTGTGESPLAAISKWVNVKCPQCRGKARRETNTMPQWAGSSWYYLRYEDPTNRKALMDPKKEKYWSPVDLYVGGAEHATRHLIYARFWHKFLYDIGVTSTIEPFIKLQSVGLIMGEDGRKMSKRFGNVINPDEIVKTFGADALRIYEMFMGPFDQQISWSTDSIVGSRRFIEKVWRLGERIRSQKLGDVTIEGQRLTGTPIDNRKVSNINRDKFTDHNQKLESIIHKTIKKVTEDIQNLRFNTAVSTLMIAVNSMESGSASREQFETILKLLAPFAPHVTEELWMLLGHKESIHTAEWPKYSEELAKEHEVRIIVQVNGKVRASFEATRGVDKSELEKRAKELPGIARWLAGRTILRTIIVPDRLVNIVVDSQ